MKKRRHHWKTNVADHEGVTAPPAPLEGGRRWRRADTNVVSIKLNKLIDPGNMHTGDAVYCQQCDAVLSKISKLINDGPDKVWLCEFCGKKNLVDIVDEEIPAADDVTYMLEPAPATTASGPAGLDQSLIVFCVDCSGSMCVTTEVPGKVRLRGSERLDRLQSLNDSRESQWMPGQRRNVTYVSRLQGVQAAVDHQLGQMATDHPHKRAALVAFNSEVTVVGDGTSEPVHLSGDKLNNKDQIQAAVSDIKMPTAIKQTRKKLGDKVFDLEEGGQTALGPALLLSVSLAGQVPGSKVIICTDGMANVGLGNLDTANQNEEEHEVAIDFYTDVIHLANEKGVSVSVITIKGTDCKLVDLGRISDGTGGQINIVDPQKLTEEFGSILADPVIATNVTAIFLLHKDLYVRYEENEDSKVVRTVGNASAETEITFEFGVRTQSKRMKMGDEKDKSKKPPAEGESEAAAGGSSSSSSTSTTHPSELPFQLQLTYTDIEGAKALRVLTQNKPVTKSRDVAEKHMKVEVLGTHVCQNAARMALEGHYTASRMQCLMNDRLVYRSSQGEGGPVQKQQRKKWKKYVTPIEKKVSEQQMSERGSRGRSYSDDEDECDAVCEAAGAVPDRPPARSTKGKLLALFSRNKSNPAEKKYAGAAYQRRREVSDSMANFMYQNIASTHSQFQISSDEDDDEDAAAKSTKKPTKKK